MSCARLLLVISIVVAGCIDDEQLTDDELALEDSGVDERNASTGADDESRTNCELILFGIVGDSPNQVQTPPPPPECLPNATLSAGQAARPRGRWMQS